MSKFLHEILGRKRSITLSKNGGLPPLLVWVPLLIVNKYCEFQVNIFINNRDIIKCQSFCMTPDDDDDDSADDARAMTIPRGLLRKQPSFIIFYEIFFRHMSLCG